MRRRAVRLSPEARADLLSLYEWIADAAALDIALGYIDRLKSYVRGFDVASERGTRRVIFAPDCAPSVSTVA